MKRHFESLSLPEKDHNPRSIHLAADATFFGKKNHDQWGVLVFRDASKKENLWWKFIEKEEVHHYVEGKYFLQDKGYSISSVTIDGFRGLLNVFNDIPIQFCHFHQKQISMEYGESHYRMEPEL